MRENMRYAHFCKKCEILLQSHDRYKPVSLNIECQFAGMTVMVLANT